MKYEMIGKPQVQDEYTEDKWETVLSANLRREDGVTGDVWIVAGVPDYHVGSSRAAGHQLGFERVRTFGDSPDCWCPDSFDSEDRDEIIEAVESAAIQAHRERIGTAR